MHNTALDYAWCGLRRPVRPNIAQGAGVPVPFPPPLRGRPFTRAAAVAAGLPPYVLRGSRFRRLFRGVYVCTDVPASPELDYDAVRLLLPADAAASHHLAARLRGLPVPDEPLTHMCVAGPGRDYSIAGLRVHRVSGDTPVVKVRARRVTSVRVTFLELAGVLSLSTSSPRGRHGAARAHHA